jgi:hypothetical protein
MIANGQVHLNARNRLCLGPAGKRKPCNQVSQGWGRVTRDHSAQLAVVKHPKHELDEYHEYTAPSIQVVLGLAGHLR